MVNSPTDLEGGMFIFVSERVGVSACFGFLESMWLDAAEGESAGVGIGACSSWEPGVWQQAGKRPVFFWETLSQLKNRSVGRFLTNQK